MRVPRAHNANLHAQSGLFVLYWPHDGAVAPGDDFNPLSFDAVTTAVFAKLAASHAAEVAAYSPVIRAVSAPARFAPATLRLLADLGVSAASVFPGYGGSAEAVLERRLWDR